MSAWIEPRRTLRLTSSTATKPLNSLVRPRVSRMISAVIAGERARRPRPLSLAGGRAWGIVPGILTGAGAAIKAMDQKKSRKKRDLRRMCPGSRTPWSAAAASEGDRPLVAAHVVHHPGPLAGTPGEESVEAAGRALAATGRAGDEQRRRVGHALDRGSRVSREVLVAIDAHPRCRGVPGLSRDRDVDAGIGGAVWGAGGEAPRGERCGRAGGGG